MFNVKQSCVELKLSGYALSYSCQSLSSSPFWQLGFLSRNTKKNSSHETAGEVIKHLNLVLELTLAATSVSSYSMNT